jgi:hypothetical protein
MQGTTIMGGDHQASKVEEGVDSVEHWSQAVWALSLAKKEELHWREKVLSEKFHDLTGTGTKSLLLDNGSKIKAVFKHSYKITAETDLCHAVINKMKIKFPDEAEIIDGLIKSSLSLSIANYGKLSDKSKSFMSDILESSYGLPSLTIVPPKIG